MIRFLPSIALLMSAASLSPFVGFAAAGDGLVTTSNGLAIVPFAVPVAVPVAVVQRPTVFYGVAAYASSLPSHAAPVVEEPAVRHLPSSASSVDDPWRAQVAPLLERRCAECHRGAQAQGEFMLFDADGRLLDKLPRHLVVEQATSASAADAAPARPAMPPGEREPLSSDEQALVRRWGKLPKRLSY